MHMYAQYVLAAIIMISTSPGILSFFWWQIIEPGLSRASWGATWPQVWGQTVVWAGSQTEPSISLLNSQEHGTWEFWVLVRVTYYSSASFLHHVARSYTMCHSFFRTCNVTSFFNFNPRTFLKEIFTLLEFFPLTPDFQYFLLFLYFQFIGADVFIIATSSHVYSIVFGTWVILSNTETFSCLWLGYGH